MNHEPPRNRGSFDAPAPERWGRWRAAIRLWRAELIYVAVLTVFAVLAGLAHAYRYFDWDLTIARFIQTLPIPGMFGWMRAVSLMGDRWIPYALTAIATLAFLAGRRRQEAAGLLLSVGVGETVNRALKVLIARPRPTPDLVTVFRHIPSQSFPSGHVTFYVCYFGFLFFVAYALLPRGSWVRRLALLFTALPVALVGVSRVYLGEHWPSDTLGAYLLSDVWLAIVVDLYRRWKQPATSD